MPWIVWVLIALAALVGEAVTTGLFLASIAVAALLAAGLSLVAPALVQFIAFGLISLVFLGAVRPVILRLLPSGESDSPSHVGLVGQQALAVGRVDGRQGIVRVGGGEFWTARTTEPGLVIEPGSDVEIVQMQGLTARVKPVGGGPGSGSGQSESAGLAHALAETQVHAFLFADIRGYTRFTHEHGDEASASLVTKFVALAREGVIARGGQVIELRGDEVLAVFASPRQALRAAVEIQSRFALEETMDPNLPLPVGMGLDAGEAVSVEGGYRGGALNLASRLCSLACAGEVLATEELAHLAGRMDELVCLSRPPVEVKGVSEPVRVVQVVPRARQADGVNGADRDAALGAADERSAESSET